MTPPSLPGNLRVLRGMLTFWTALWLAVGCWSGYEIWQLTGLSAATVDSGRALQSAGQALGDLGDLPVVGQRINELGGQVAAAATEVTVSARAAGTSIRSLSILIGLAVALGPSVPPLALYVLWRRGRSDLVAARTDSRSAAGPGA